MFWNGKTKISMEEGLRLSDIAHGIDNIFLAKTLEREEKHILTIDGFL